MKERSAQGTKDNSKIKNLFQRLLLFCGKKPSEDDLLSSESSSGADDDDEFTSKMTYEEIAIYVDTKARLEIISTKRST